MPAEGNDEIVESREQRYDFFFYGTLLVPAILARVLGRKCEDLTFQDALLENYTRHCVKNADYPAILHESESRLILHKDHHTSTDLSTRGTLVHGLAYDDVKALDVFEGSQYKRVRVSVQTLTEASSDQRIPQDRSGVSIGGAVNNSQALRQVKGLRANELPDWSGTNKAVTGSGQAECWTYVWKDDLQDLQPQVWSFDAFMRDKASDWMEDDSNEYEEVDQLRGVLQEHADKNSEKGVEDEDLLEGRTMDGYPDFGHGMLKYWKFRPELINLNHGSYGSPPRPVVDRMRALSDQVESFPDLFMRRSWLPLLNAVRGEVASLIGAKTDECVIVPNTTHGINTIMFNLKWQPGDVIVIYSTTYGAVAQMMKCVCDFHPEVRLEIIDLDFPCSHESILQKTEALLEKYNGKRKTSSYGTTSSSTERVKLVVVDSIASNPGVIYPWEGVVKICKKYNAISLVDAAHSIGQIKTDVKRSDPDFWVSNCHKWLMSHRGGAVMYVPLRTFPTSAGYESERYPTMGVLRQKPEVNTAVNGTTAEEGEVLGNLNRSWSFERQYDWTGTVDWTPFLSVTAALDFRRSIGGEERIMKYCHSLAERGGKRLSKRWGTQVMDMPDGSLTAAMVNIEVPAIAEPRDADEAFLQRTYFEDGLLRANRYAAPYRHAGRWWARFSAQVWVELDDFDKVAEAIEVVCEELRQGKHFEKDIPNTGALHAAADVPAHDA